MSLATATELKKLESLKIHGGQAWRKLDNYVGDFSVTTNGIGTNQNGIKSLMEAIPHISHYPASNNEPCLTNIASFIWDPKFANDDDFKMNKERMILGNGSSELIDLIVRYCKLKGALSFRPGPSVTQYKDYQRCAQVNSLKLKKHDECNENDLLCIVNPTNPTGDYLTIEQIKSIVETKVSNNSHVIIDESMLFWYGEQWRKQSLTSHLNWIDEIKKNNNINIFIIHSYTKIWNCCGIRIGSVITPTKDIADEIRATQTPWSVNSLALAFASAASQDEEYLRQTWESTTKWRFAMVSKLNEMFPKWTVSGEKWLSWIWCDTHDSEIAEKCSIECEKYGVPIRWAKQGYHQPTCLRFGVRGPNEQYTLFNALKNIANVYDSSANEDDDNVNEVNQKHFKHNNHNHNNNNNNNHNNHNNENEEDTIDIN